MSNNTQKISFPTSKIYSKINIAMNEGFCD